MKDKATFITLAVLLIVCVSFANIAQDIFRNEHTDDLMTRLKQINRPHSYDLIFRDLRPLLPERGMLGFFHDAPPAGVSTRVAETAPYYQAQYAVCPLVLCYSTNHSQVLALYRDFQPGMELGTVTNTHTPVTATLGGAMLLRKERKK